MRNEREKQANFDAVDSEDAPDTSTDTGEERMRNAQIIEEGRQQNRREARESKQEHRNEIREARSEDDFAPLFENNEAEGFRTQWLEIQSRFVDDPSVSVKDADDLVADVIKNITRSFADKRMSLESQWKSGDVSTEELRVAMKRYRSFFNRLLSLQS
jgi:hypothetical protein